MRRSRLLILALALLAPVVPVRAGDPTYEALRAARPDGRTVRLDGFELEIDVFRFRLDGVLHLLTAVEGETPGAVFVGRGSYRLTPVTVAERRHLAIVAQDDALEALEDTFPDAVFLGTALPAAALRHAGASTGAPAPDAAALWDAYLKKQRNTLTTNVHVRVLAEILDRSGPFFLAWIDGKKHPPAVLVHDPRGAESVRLAGRQMGGEQTMMLAVHEQKGGIWYSCRAKAEIEAGRARVLLPPADAESFVIDSTIDGASLEQTATMTFTANAAIRVLPLVLAPTLRLSAAELSPAADPPSWTPAAIIQEADEEDADAAVVFGAPLEAGQRYLLRTTAGGREVLARAGDGSFTVHRRTSWYPNVGGFGDLAAYEMRFRTPAKLQVVGVGTEVENRVADKQRVAVWKTERPVRVAGFNYGDFEKQVDTDDETGLAFAIYTSAGTSDAIARINQGLETVHPVLTGLSHVRIDAKNMSRTALADGINTARVGTVFFGPLENGHVSITQQSQWFFGQSWPTLIYLPYVAVLDGYTRMSLGLGGASDFVDLVGPHEMGHQWWGHQIGFHSYRDEWISEGFSEFTASIVKERTDGVEAYVAFYDKARRRILEKPRGALIDNLEAGPISQGWRVASWRNPYAYGPVVYSKGAFVLHMLRMAMRDQEKGDEAFIEMMREFASRFRGKEASTDDFQAVVEKHATKNLRLTDDGRLDWFFDQWVHGTAIPRLEGKFSSSRTEGGKYAVTGTVTQSEVPDDFASVVGLYVHFPKGRTAKLGTIPIVGSSTRPVQFTVTLPDKPEKISINALHDVLSR
jgi:hypothetical protein